MTLADISDWISATSGLPQSAEGLFIAGMTLASFLAFLFAFRRFLRDRPTFATFEGATDLSPWTSLDIRRMLLYFLAFWLILFVVAALFQAGILDPGNPPLSITAASLMVIILSQGFMLLFLVDRLRFYRMRPGTFLGITATRTTGKMITLGIILFLASLPVIELANLAWNAFMGYMGIEPSIQPVLALFMASGESMWVYGLLALCVTLSGPIFEEALFRGIILPVVTRRFGPTYAITIVSLFFALGHLNAYGLFPIFVLAVAFSLGYAVTGSLLVPMTMHVCFNLTQLTYFAIAMRSTVPGGTP